MKALGLIETKGLLAAIECADAMLKSADVNLLEKAKVGGGLITITVSGDVGAVKAAVEAGAAAVRQLDNSLLISEHVIPRPHEDLKDVVISATPLIDKLEESKSQALEEKRKVVETIKPKEEKEETVVELQPEEEPEATLAEETVEEETKALKPEFKATTDSLHKEDIDKMVAESNIDEVITALYGQKVTKLRSLAREFKDFGITGRKVSKADKTLLLKEFKAYYENK